MSEPIEGAAPTAAPADTPAPAAPAAPPPADPAPTGEGLSLTSDQLRERLDRAREAERKALVDSLGFTLEEAKAAVEAKRQQEEAQKTLEERLALERAAREKDSQELQRYRETVAMRAQHELDSLSDEQRAAVSAIAGDDAAQQLATITALRPTWNAAAPPTEEAKPKTPPATTAAPRQQPSDAGSQSRTDHAAEYERLKSNPETRAAAGLYLNRFSREIFAARRGNAS